jgi:hypothetical protein
MVYCGTLTSPLPLYNWLVVVWSAWYLEFSNCSEQIVANWVIIMWKAHQVPLRGFNEFTESLKDKSNPVMERGLQTWGLN